MKRKKYFLSLDNKIFTSKEKAKTAGINILTLWGPFPTKKYVKWVKKHRQGNPFFLSDIWAIKEYNKLQKKGKLRKNLRW